MVTGRCGKQLPVICCLHLTTLLFQLFLEHKVSASLNRIILIMRHNPLLHHTNAETYVSFAVNNRYKKYCTTSFLVCKRVTHKKQVTLTLEETLHYFFFCSITRTIANSPNHFQNPQNEISNFLNYYNLFKLASQIYFLIVLLKWSRTNLLKVNNCFF